MAITPRVQCLLQHSQKMLRLYCVVAIPLKSFKLIDLLGNPPFALRDIPPCGREMIPLRGKPQPVLFRDIHAGILAGPLPRRKRISVLREKPPATPLPIELSGWDDVALMYRRSKG